MIHCLLMGLVSEIPDVQPTICPAYEDQTRTGRREHPTGYLAILEHAGLEDSFIDICSPDYEMVIMESEYNVIQERGSIQTNDSSHVPLGLPHFTDIFQFGVVFCLFLGPVHLEQFPFITGAYELGMFLVLLELDEGTTHHSSSIWSIQLHSIMSSPRNTSDIYRLLLFPYLSSSIQFLSNSSVPEQNLPIFTDTQELVLYILVSRNNQVVQVFTIKFNTARQPLYAQHRVFVRIHLFSQHFGTYSTLTRRVLQGRHCYRVYLHMLIF